MDPYGYNDPSDDEDNEHMEAEEVDDHDDNNMEGEHYAETMSTPNFPGKEPRHLNDEVKAEDCVEEDDGDDGSDSSQSNDFWKHGTAFARTPEAHQPRGKPEAMHANIMRAKAEASRLEIKDDEDSLGEDEDDDDDGQEATAAVLKPDPSLGVVASAIPKKMSVPSSKSAAIGGGKELRKRPSPPKKKTAPSHRSPSTSPTNESVMENLLETQTTRPISEQEYENLDNLMEQFCRVPLLAEFSRPVKLLHPEVCVPSRQGDTG